MLDPQSRRLFLESLSPPDGYALDCAIGTTFSLDLLALLSVPLAFTFSDWEDSEGQPTDDNLALLESIKRHAGRISIFCQAGQISVPKKDQRLFAYLEKSVFEVTAKKKFGVFHPKIWLLRFTSNQDPVVRYRFICLSRNLTYDRSWDTVLVMDGVLQERKNAYKVNHPLGDFIRSLPELTALTGRSVPEDVQQRIDTVQDEVRKVLFELPSMMDGKNRFVSFDEYRFWPIGLNSRPEWPFDGTDDEMAHRRMLIISPFLKDAFLKRVIKKRKNCILVSRTDEAIQVPKSTCDLFGAVYTLSSDALPEDLDIESDEESTLSGLHAKLFLMDDGYTARLWTGSANATNAAFPDPQQKDDRDKGNIEFLVELVGAKSKFGIDQLLNKVTGVTSFADMLEPFIPSDEVPDVDAVQKILEHELDNARRLLACQVLRAVVTAGEIEGSYSIQLISTEPLIGPDDIVVRCWPVTFQEHLASTCPSSAGVLATFGGITLDAITAFFAFEMILHRSGKKAKSRFVVKADLEGVPEGRFSCLLRSLLKNRNQVVQMLLMLLSDQDIPCSNVGGKSRTPGGGANTNSSAEIPLLESLLRALDRDPEKIDRINALVNDLMATNEGIELLPEGFNDIWPAIWAAREGLK